MSDIFDNFSDLLDEVCQASPQDKAKLKGMGINTDCLCTAAKMEPKTLISYPKHNTQINFKKHSSLATTPKRQKSGDVGFDLSATEDATILPAYDYSLDLVRDYTDFDSLELNYELELKNTHVTAVSTGISVEFPKGYYGEIVSRSGLAYKHGVIVLNAPGIIDEGYTGQIKVLLVNLSSTPFYVKPGDRIAQILIKRYDNFEFTEVETIRDTERGTNGLGSTGVK